MTHPQSLPILADEQLPAAPAPDEAGFGALATSRGALPLVAMDVRAHLCGLLAEVQLEQTFVNSAAEPIEATYLFPLPDRAAVTRFELRVGERLIEGVLKERAAARAEYDAALATGHRAAIAEENRPDVFSLRVGNLLPGEQAVVSLTLAGPLEYADGEATFRFPLVVAPRYIPGLPLSGESVGPGTVPDTNLVPDASLITPPVLLPGFPNPVRLSLKATVDPAGLAIGQISSSLFATETRESDSGRRIVTIQPGERLNRDFILRLPIAQQAIKSSLVLAPDTEGDEGTFLLTLVPPADAAKTQRPRDVVLLLDRSGSMGGWKVVAARRAAARIVDSLTPADRFAVMAFDDSVETPALNTSGKSQQLSPATDRNRFRAVEFLARLDARGGTELAEPLARAAQVLAGSDPARDRILVLVTDGQVGNEDHLLATIAPQAREIRIFTLGIDQAVNAGFLRRLAAVGGGACDLVESEDRLDAVLDKIHRRIGTPILTGVQLADSSWNVDGASLVPSRLPDLFAGVPLVIQGRYQGKYSSPVTVTARDALGDPWSAELMPATTDQRAIAAVWARGRIRDLEDQLAVGRVRSEETEKQIVATSLRFGVLSRFTAFVAVDRSEVANRTDQRREIVQPVELPAGWEEQDRRALRSFHIGGTAVACAAPAPMDACLAMDADEDSSRGLILEEKLLGSVFGMMPSRPPASPPANRQIALKKQRGVACRSSAAESETLAKPAFVPDLAAYRARAAEWLETLRSEAAGDVAAQRNLLRKLARDLADLVADLDSVGAEPSVHVPLAVLETLLAGLGPTTPPAEVSRLWHEAEQTLEAFVNHSGTSPAATATARGSFWKQPPVTT
jgi:Ca-activated chloride channel family protein